MNKITLKRIVHRDRRRLALDFGYAPELNSIAKRIRGAKYSGTLKRWYIDDSEENLKMILEAFRGKAFVDITPIIPKSNNSSPETDDNSEVPEIPRTVKTEEFRQLPEEKNDGIAVALAEITCSGYAPVEFRLSDSRLIVKFTGRYDPKWIDELKSYGRTYYDKTRKEFYLHWSKQTTDSLSDYFSDQGVPVRIIRPQVDPALKDLRKNFSDEVRSRELNSEGEEAIEFLKDHLNSHRYSGRTGETYIALLGLFFRFFNDRTPDEITQNDVADFINDFIIKNGFSASYQNQMISAIKMYYDGSGRGKVIPQFLERPRRGRALPKVFSKEEVSRILNSVRNTKHKLLLWIIYSCGLRRSEVTNIRLDDIDRTRGIIHIREGKGGVDRIVPVSAKVWQKIDEYLCNYVPAKYLFEGQKGGKYSVESVYNVFKQALKKAGINKEVGVHCLRHSYATHLHENGLDIRYIQELLGHKSTRTTEIYTHVSRRNLMAVKSPIEDMDVK